MQFFLTYLSRTHAIIINKYHSIKKILIKACLRNFIQTFGGRLSCWLFKRQFKSKMCCSFQELDSLLSTFYLLVQYFDRRRELANSVLVSSVSFGGLVLPPLYRYFLDVYGLRGTMLIVSGLMLNVVALAGLLKPPPFSVLYPKAMLFKSLKLTSILQFRRAKSAPHLWVKECYLEMVYQHLLKRKQHGLVCQIGWMLLENEMALVSLKVCRI